MKFWLDKPCSELSRQWLLDEHRSLHAYINDMIKNPSKWCAHKLLGPMIPSVLFIRHEEEVQEILSRGYKHGSPLDISAVNLIEHNRAELGLYNPGEYLKAGKVVVDVELKELQEQYRRNL